MGTPTWEIAVWLGVVAALAAGLLVLVVAHGILKPMLEALGVTPWLLRDSIGALPLVLVGSAACVGSVVWFTAWLALSSATPSAETVATIATIAAASAFTLGVLSIRLGVLALRKLI